MTQAELAMQIGIHIGQLKKYEQGRTVPGGDALAAIAATGVNVNWLLTGVGPMRADGAGQAAAQPPAGGLGGAPPQAANSGDSPMAGRFSRRMAALAGMLGNMPEPEANALIDEFASRAQTQQQLAELKQAVQQLSSAQAKRA